MKVRPRNLILDLLLASEPRPLCARQIISAGGLFGITANNTRVTLVRLSTEGLIESAGRGSYRLSPQAHELADEVATWRRAEQRLRPWDGGWIVCHSALLGRSDRTVLRRRQRALDMLGFRELERELHVRPDNIETDVEAVRQRLLHLGLEREATVFRGRDFGAVREQRIPSLWDTAALNRGYDQGQQRLERWMGNAEALDDEAAVRESFLLGGRGIHDVLFDPLLPEPMVDVDARAAYFDTVRRFDRLGQKIWGRFLAAMV